MNSLRFRLVLLLILIGVIPCVLLRIGMLNSYENRAVSLRTSEILSQAKILANQIVSNDYLEIPVLLPLTHSSSSFPLSMTGVS